MPSLEVGGIERWHRITLQPFPDRACAEGLAPTLHPGRCQPDAIRGKNHPVKALRDRLGFAGQEQHIGSIGVQADFQESLHPAGGRQPAALDQCVGGGRLQVSTGLPLKKSTGAGTLQTKGRKHGIPHRRHAPSSSEQAEISERRNRLTRSRSAAAMASAPPSSRSTIVITRCTRYPASRS